MRCSAKTLLRAVLCTSVALAVIYSPWVHVSAASPAARVSLEVVKVTPERDEDGYLLFRLRMRMTNHSSSSIWIQESGVESNDPHETEFFRSFDQAQWLRVSNLWHTPGPIAKEIRPANTLEFEKTVPSVFKILGSRKNGIPLRGFMRVQVHYYGTKASVLRAVDTGRGASAVAVAHFNLVWPDAVICFTGYWPHSGCGCK